MKKMINANIKYQAIKEVIQEAKIEEMSVDEIQLALKTIDELEWVEGEGIESDKEAVSLLVEMVIVGGGE